MCSINSVLFTKVPLTSGVIIGLSKAGWLRGDCRAVTF
jgi:hypothetical protein